VLVAAPILAVPLAIDETPQWSNTLIAFVMPLFLLICHVIKYRRFEPGSSGSRSSGRRSASAAGCCC
jgi:hypothetical protein